jgi:hypothetical protein
MTETTELPADPPPVDGKLRLNLGSGWRPAPSGWTNVDRAPETAPDLVWDLETLPWPWDDGAVHEVRLVHVLHTLAPSGDWFIEMMAELHRVLEPGGVLTVVVPHMRSDDFWRDPRVRPVTVGLLQSFCKRLNHQVLEMNLPWPTVALERDIDFEIDTVTISLLPRWAQALKNGEVSNDELAAAVETHANVAAEVMIVMHKTGGAASNGGALTTDWPKARDGIGSGPVL